MPIKAIFSDGSSSSEPSGGAFFDSHYRGQLAKPKPESPEEYNCLVRSFSTLGIESKHQEITDVPPKVELRQPERWFYRVWHRDTSRGRKDFGGDIVCGSTAWLPPPHRKSDIAYHFTQYHSDGLNRLDTCLVSATSDIIRALKRAVSLDTGTDIPTFHSSNIIVSIICSAEYYFAEDLLDIARNENMVLSQLTKDAISRLFSPKFQRLHEKEVVFLHQIPKEDIRFEITLQQLYTADLRVVLPELWYQNPNPDFDRMLSPSEIRNHIEHGPWHDEVQVMLRYVDIFWLVAAGGGRCEWWNSGDAKALKRTRQMLSSDALLSAPVKYAARYDLQRRTDDLFKRRRRRKSVYAAQHM